MLKEKIDKLIDDIVSYYDDLNYNQLTQEELQEGREDVAYKIVFDKGLLLEQLREEYNNSLDNEVIGLINRVVTI